jgi:hypothetical protein
VTDRFGAQYRVRGCGRKPIMGYRPSIRRSHKRFYHLLTAHTLQCDLPPDVLEASLHSFVNIGLRDCASQAFTHCFAMCPSVASGAPLPEPIGAFSIYWSNPRKDLCFPRGPVLIAPFDWSENLNAQRDRWFQSGERSFKFTRTPTTEAVTHGTKGCLGA